MRIHCTSKKKQKQRRRPPDHAGGLLRQYASSKTTSDYEFESDPVEHALLFVLHLLGRVGGLALEG